MKWYKYITIGFLIYLSACSIQTSSADLVSSNLPPTAITYAKTFPDPFSFCAEAGTIDVPDARYTGDQVPIEIINGFKKAAALESSTETIEEFKKTTIWRCMNHQVYACNFGANLPCDSKADADKTPSQALKEYCSASPDGDFIPAYVTGRTTIYSWQCIKGAPVVFKQVEEVDAAGYWAQIWYEIKPGN